MSALDPVLLSLLSIFGGVLVTVLGGFLGAWIQHRRAHRAWLRERRYEAYVGAYALIKSFDLNRFKTSKIAARGEASVAEWESADRDAMTPAEIEALESKMADIRRLVAEADDLYSTVATVLAPVILIGPRRSHGTCTTCKRRMSQTTTRSAKRLFAIEGVVEGRRLVRG